MKRVRLLAAAAALSVGAAGNAEAIEFRLLTSWDKTNPAVPLLAEGFAKKIEADSKGDMKFIVSGPETVPPFEQLQPVQSGVFQFLFTHPVYHFGTTGIAVGLDALGGDPKSRRESGVFDLVDRGYQKLGVKVVAIAISAKSGYNIVLRAPLSPAGNLEGKKIRTTPSYFGVLKMLGATTVTLRPSEIYTGLEKGVIDGTTWPAVGVLGPRWYEVAKYLVRPTFGVTTQLMLMNLAKWNELNPDQRKIVTAAGHAMEDTWYREYDRLAAEEEKALVGKGMTIVNIPEPHRSKLDKAWADGVWGVAKQKSPKEVEEIHSLAKSKGLTN